MSAKIRIDDRHFRRTLEKYLEVSGKDLAQVLNDKAVSVMIEAGRNTKIADKKKIRSTFKWTKSHKKGLRAWALKYAPNLKTDKERKAWFTKIKNARIKSVAYLRAGWTAPLRKMKKAAKSKSKATIRGAGKSSPKLRGRARPAKAGYKAQATFENWAGAQSKSDKKRSGQKHSQSEAAKKYGEKGLAKGFAAVKKDIQVYLERKLNKSAKRLGVGRR